MSESFLSRVRRLGANSAHYGFSDTERAIIDAQPSSDDMKALPPSPVTAAAPHNRTPSGRVRPALPAAPVFNPHTMLDSPERNAERHKFVADLLQMILIRLNGQAERTMDLVGSFENLPSIFNAQQERLDLLPAVLEAVQQIPGGNLKQVEALGTVVEELRTQTTQHEKTGVILHALNRELAAQGNGVRDLQKSNTEQIKKLQTQQTQALTIVMKNQRTQWQALQKTQTRVIEELNARHAEAIANIHQENQAVARRMTRMAIGAAAAVMVLFGGALVIAKSVMGSAVASLI